MLATSLRTPLRNSDGSFSSNDRYHSRDAPGQNLLFVADLAGNGKIEDIVVSNSGSANTVNVFLSLPPVYTIDTPTAHIAASPNATQTAGHGKLAADRDGTF